MYLISIIKILSPWNARWLFVVSKLLLTHFIDEEIEVKLQVRDYFVFQICGKYEPLNFIYYIKVSKHW